MTPEQLAEAKRYGRQGLVCTLADKALDVAYLAVMALLLARPLDDWLARSGVLQRVWSLRLVALFLIVFALHVLVSFPLSCYAGHILERRYGLSRQSFAAWLRDYGKTLALAAVFGLILWLGLFWLIWLTGRYWWLFGAASAFAVNVVMVQLYPVLIMPLFRKCEPLDHPDLAARMARLAEGTGLSIAGLYRRVVSEDTVKLGASLAGLGRTRRVHLDDTLLRDFTPEEIEVVMAHEIGHHVFRHLWKLIVAGIFASAAGFWICDRLLTAWMAHWEAAADLSRLPVSALPLVMLILSLFGMLLGPLQNAVSRRYERQCDRYALRRTGLKDAYLSAFRKLAQLNKDDPSPHWLDVLLFHSHPPIGERLAMAEKAVGSRQ